MQEIIQHILSTHGIDHADRVEEHARSWVVFAGGERPSVFRIAKNKEAGLGVLNEAAWNKVARPILLPMDVVIPEVISEGREGDLAWVRYEQIDGRPLGNGQTLVANEAFGDIIDRTVEIMSTLDAVSEAAPIPLDDPEDPETYKQERTNRLRQQTQDIIRDGVLTEDDVDRAVDTFQALMRHYDRRLQHHDIVPWNMLDLGASRLGLIDAEFGGMRVRFYDAAYTLCKLHATIKNDEWTQRFWARCREAFANDGFDEKVLLPMSFTASREISERHSRGDQEGVDRLKHLMHCVTHHAPITF